MKKIKLIISNKKIKNQYYLDEHFYEKIKIFFKSKKKYNTLKSIFFINLNKKTHPYFFEKKFIKKNFENKLIFICLYYLFYFDRFMPDCFFYSKLHFFIKYDQCEKLNFDLDMLIFMRNMAEDKVHKKIMAIN